MKTIITNYKSLEVKQIIGTKTQDICEAKFYETKTGAFIIDYIDTDTNEVWHRSTFLPKNKQEAEYAFSQIETGPEYELYLINSGNAIKDGLSGKRAAIELKFYVDKGESENGNRWVSEDDETIKLITKSGQVLQRISIRKS